MATNGKKAAPAKKNRLTGTEIKDRRQQAMRLRVQGLSAGAIAKLLQTSAATISSDLKIIQADNLKKVDEFKSNHFMAEAMEKFDLVFIPGANRSGGREDDQKEPGDSPLWSGSHLGLGTGVLRSARHHSRWMERG